MIRPGDYLLDVDGVGTCLLRCRFFRVLTLCVSDVRAFTLASLRPLVVGDLSKLIFGRLLLMVSKAGPTLL